MAFTVSGIGGNQRALTYCVSIISYNRIDLEEP